VREGRGREYGCLEEMSGVLYAMGKGVRGERGFQKGRGKIGYQAGETTGSGKEGLEAAGWIFICWKWGPN